jgi:hypothetical protein
VKTVFLRFWEMADWKAPPPPGKLKNEDKAWILSWKEDGMSTAEIAKRLGRHRASTDRLWAKSKGLPKFVIPQRKIGSGRPKKKRDEEDAEETGCQISGNDSCRPAKQCA